MHPLRPLALLLISLPGLNLIVVDDINGGLFVVEYTGS